MEKQTDANLQSIVQKGHRAKALLNDPLINQAFVQMKAKYLLEFESANLEDDRKRMDAWRKGQVLKDFEEQFIKLIKQGDNAELTLIERAKNKLKNII